jgi:hypothetical protein
MLPKVPDGPVYQPSGYKEVDNMESYQIAARKEEREAETRLFKSYLEVKDAMFKVKLAEMDVKLAEEGHKIIQQDMMKMQYEALND